MQLIGKLDQDKRGVGSIIGATFLVFVLLSGFTFYILTVNINEDYTAVLQIMDQLDLQRKQENVEFVGISTTNEDKLNVTVENVGSHQTHLIWLGIFDETVTPNIQEYRKMDVYINPAETLSNLPEINITILEGQERVIQLVTELGNTFNSGYPIHEEEEVAQATITITGKECTATYNPSQWNLLGSTEHASGSISDLASNDTNYVVFRSFSSGSETNITLLNDGFEGVDWDENWDQYGVNDWLRTSFPVHSGTWSAWGTGSSTTLTSDSLNASGANYVYVEFWFMKDDIENNEFRLYYWDGSQYDLIRDLDLLGSDDVWLRYTHNITDNQYFREDFHIRFDCTSMTGTGENVWVDDVLIKKQVGADEYTAEVEFVGSSNLENWSKLVWRVDSAWDIGQVTVTIQFFNFTSGDFAPSGNGYTSYISSATPNIDELKLQSIDSNPNDFKNSTGQWRVKIKGVKATSAQFLFKVDWVDFETTYSTTSSTVLYNVWQWYTIRATTASGDPIPYGYVSIYANGTSVAFRNATDKASIANPAWVRLDSRGEFQLEIRSTSGSPETFVLYAVVGSVVGEKTITQEAP